MATALTTARHAKSAFLIALVAAAFALALAFAPSDCAHADEPTAIPLVMVVVGFDGGGDPDAAVPYDDEYDWSASLFDPGESPASYYLDMSGGSFTFAPAHETSAYGADGNSNVADAANDGVVHVTLHRSHGAWGAVNVDPAVTRDFAVVVTEALQAAGDYVDFASYDADHDGELAERELAICLCVAGYEGASVEDFRRDDVPLVWSHAGYLSVIGNDRVVDGMGFDTYIAIAERNWDESLPIEEAEQEPLGTVYHELGHALGLPDLYAVTVTEGPWEECKVGALSLMDQGGWQYADDGAGYRNIPTSLDAWSRYVLGWAEPAIVAHSGDYTVSGQLSDAGYSQLAVPTSDPDEYFLVEYRPPEGHDASLAEDDAIDGLVIWHVDNGIFERFYDANTVNDADHRPAVMDEAVFADEPVELMLYGDAGDGPEAQEPSGITVQAVSETGHDAIVHIDLNEASAARNAAHLLKDPARDKLTQSEPSPLQRAATIIKAVV